MTNTFHRLTFQRRELKKTLQAMRSLFSIRVHNYNNTYQALFVPHNIGQDGYVVIERSHYQWVKHLFRGVTEAAPYTALERQSLEELVAYMAQTVDILHISAENLSTNCRVIAFKFR